MLPTTTCVVCGTPIAPERAEVTEEGLRCAPCGLRAQIAGHERNVELEAEEREQARLGRLARRMARAHIAVVLACTLALCLPTRHEAQVPTGMVAAFALLIGLSMGWRWAFVAALAIDALATLALLYAAMFAAVAPEARLAALALACVPPLIGFLLWRVRRFYFGSPSRAAGPSR